MYKQKLTAEERLLYSIFCIAPPVRHWHDVMRQRALESAFAKILKTLMHKEYEVLVLRYGFVDGYCHTPEQIARICGMTRERALRVLMRALKKLQDPFRSRLLEQFLPEEYLTKRGHAS